MLLFVLYITSPSLVIYSLLFLRLKLFVILFQKDRQIIQSNYQSKKRDRNKLEIQRMSCVAYYSVLQHELG
jgi:hypothetical protein